jgi:hypothetical protein
LVYSPNAPAAESVLQFIQGNNILADKGFIGNTKSVEYRLVMRRGTDARGKRQRGINNQFLITRFSISSRAKLIS